MYYEKPRFFKRGFGFSYSCVLLFIQNKPRLILQKGLETNAGLL